MRIIVWPTPDAWRHSADYRQGEFSYSLYSQYSYCELLGTMTQPPTLTTAMQMMPLTAATSFEHRGLRASCSLLARLAPPPPQISCLCVCVLVCSLYYKPSVNSKLTLCALFAPPQVKTELGQSVPFFKQNSHHQKLARGEPCVGEQQAGCCEQSLPRMYPDIEGVVSRSLITSDLSDQWLGPQAFTHEVVGSTPGSATFPFLVCDPIC